MPGSGCGGEPECEAGSAAGFVRSRVGGREVAALGAGEVAGDGEAEARPCAGFAAGTGGLGAVEAVEDARQVFLGYAGAGIGHGREGLSVSGVAFDGDEASRGGETEGVVEEGGQNLLRPPGIAAGRDLLGWIEANLERLAFGGGPGVEALCGLGDDARQVEGL